MKFSEQWLREWVNPSLDTDGLAAQLTMAGMEVDSVTPVAGAFSGVLVAEIVAAEPHPDADKLRVCTVNAGGEPLQIVCGAPNARVGLRAPLAVVGAELPGGLVIRKAKLRGMESQGMLCAESELGLSSAAAGLMELPEDAPIGKELREYLQLDDHTIELGLTPNRADCLSLRGIAREVALLNGLAFEPPARPAVPPSIDQTFPVRVAAPARCPRYIGRVIRGIDNRRPSPLWLTERLRRCGVRSIDAVVDVTNYVLLELGQPLHAFDLARLEGGITVREASKGEHITLLDESEWKLDADMLVIADEGGPVALAGIMGGAHSAVSENTTSVFLESAFFSPLGMAGKARRLGMHTDAAHRYERGVDYALQREAIERATELLIAICGGGPGPVTEVVSEAHLPALGKVELREFRVERLLGMRIEPFQIERIFSGLGLAPQRTETGWAVEVPSWRYDVEIEADLLEELARVHGYDRLPPSRIQAELQMPERPERAVRVQDLRRALVSRGFFEAITYSFIAPEMQRAFDPDQDCVKLQNPISADLAVMRTSLLPGLVSALRHNIKRQLPRVRLFETGLRFEVREDGLQQRPTLALVMTGSRFPESWAERSQAADFFDLKGELEALLELTGDRDAFRFERGQRNGLHPGRTALLYRGDQAVGVVGALHPELARQWDLRGEVLLCELDLQHFGERRLPAVEDFSRFPEVRRDLALVVADDVPAAALVATVRASGGSALRHVTLFDVYAGEGVPSGQRSVALGLSFRDATRTLDEAAVSGAVSAVVEAVAQAHGAALRA